MAERVVRSETARRQRARYESRGVARAPEVGTGDGPHAGRAGRPSAAEDNRLSSDAAPDHRPDRYPALVARGRLLTLTLN